MTKTMRAHFIDGTEKVITAEKTDIIIDGQKNVYKDKDGNFFRVMKRKVYGMEFYQIQWDEEKGTY